MFFQGTKLRPTISTTYMTPGREYAWRGRVTMFFQGPKLRPMISTTCMTPGREYGSGAAYSDE